MDERNNDSVEKMDEVMLPGFRFHPTDEELVGFYLRRKIQHRPLSIELIKQLDIYKYDPWDLPKLATTGEKEWYFYCPRDRKYRNSARPNRVTGAGFWKATGTDRPIYSSESSKCIGLKKSLVFYKGRAAKGIKTDWMMHEFRLPSTNESGPAKRYMDKDIPANDAWAICRIFKKASSTAQRALSHSWVSPILAEITTTPTTTCDVQTQHFHGTNSMLSSDDISLTTKTSSVIQFGDSSSEVQQQSSISSFSPLDPTFPYKSISQMTCSDLSQVSTSKCDHLSTICPLFPSSTQTTHEPSKCSSTTINDASSLLLNMSSSVFGDFGKSSSAKDLDINSVWLSQEQCSNFLMALPHDMRRNFGPHQQDDTAIVSDGINIVAAQKYEQWDNMQSLQGIPINFPVNNMAHDAWKSNLLWDSSSPSPSDISTTYSTNKCYT